MFALVPAAVWDHRVRADSCQERGPLCHRQPEEVDAASARWKKPGETRISQRTPPYFGDYSQIAFRTFRPAATVQSIGLPKKISGFWEGCRLCVCGVLCLAGAVHLAGRVSRGPWASGAGVDRGELVQSRPAVSGATGGGGGSRWFTSPQQEKLVLRHILMFRFRIHRELCHHQPFWVQRPHGRAPPPSDPFLPGQCKELQTGHWMVWILHVVNVAFCASFLLYLYPSLCNYCFL